MSAYNRCLFWQFYHYKSYCQTDSNANDKPIRVHNIIDRSMARAYFEQSTSRNAQSCFRLHFCYPRLSIVRSAITFSPAIFGDKLTLTKVSQSTQHWDVLGPPVDTKQLDVLIVSGGLLYTLVGVSSNTWPLTIVLQFAFRQTYQQQLFVNVLQWQMFINRTQYNYNHNVRFA